MELITRQLSAFAREARLDGVPTQVRHQAKRTLLNFFGCACGGARHPSVDAAIRGRGPWSGRAVAAIVGRPERYDPPLAALVNGMSSAVYSFDDTHAQALVHPGGPVASSLLPLSQIGSVTGEDFLLAFIIGAEVVCRLSKSISTPPAQARPEWVQTGVCAGVGAAFGAARLLGLSEREIASAMGIAASRASGFRGLSRSMCFSYMAGSAAETGLCSALMAQAGMIGPDEPLTADHGFCRTFSANSHMAYLTANLGVDYELAANTFKPYPCGVVIHPVIDASLSLAELVPDPQLIEEIIVEVHPATERLSDCAQPKDQFEGQVSLQHWTACAFLDRAAGVDQTKEARLFASDVGAMRRRVRITSNPDMQRSGATVRVRLRSAETLSEFVQDCRGSARRPLSDSELEAKYMSQALPVIGETAAQRLAGACWDIERLADASALLEFAVGA